ncbi:NAD(P)-dependent malic enzyme [Pontiella sulfatireligans]|uniref:NAD-dependent malic enzyme n=1 Tax=Pontiella sulfatireligans TaxID=2750658 RepID=A0A6C2UMV8_9BACT|nr:NADP-dependent malic enzyme [Pontiella sulfatireligans]VGO21615.1 NAD-dependent malic enzyme [Pontiella sulfatireligans]
MSKIENLKLENLDSLFPESFTPDQIAQGKTLFLKEVAETMHEFYGGKMQTIPKAGYYGFNWFNVWYSPGVSRVSTEIRENPKRSFDLSNRGNLIAVVSDSTRVLGDGDCGPSGGLGVMEGKAFLMKYLGGVDAIALCIDAKGEDGKSDPKKIIDFVKMIQPSVGGVNLEDISQPNCFEVLDTLRDTCDIPVWHDDAQGTGCVTLAGLINALKVAGKKMGDVKIAMLGAGASNTTIASLIIQTGGDPKKIVMCDSKGGLHADRADIEANKAFYKKWELCQSTNPNKINSIDEAMKGADVLIALSRPGPDVIKPEWVSTMADKSICFVCANPVPEIYPHAAKAAGAYIVATGRGDFPNQVNNSLCFPGLLKGALLVKAKKITDKMAIAAAYAIAESAEKNGLSPDYIAPLMDETETFRNVAKAVALQAMEDGVARVQMTGDEVYAQAKKEIDESRNLTQSLMDNNFIKEPPLEMLEDCLEKAIAQMG